MKKIFFILFIGAFVASGLSSCNKYEEGPKFSLRTKKARLVGEWILDKALLNGEDKTDNFSTDFSFTFNDDETYEHVSSGITETGEWYFNDDKTAFFVKPTNSTVPEKYYILRLTDVEIIIEKEVGDDVTTFYMDSRDK